MEEMVLVFISIMLWSVDPQDSVPLHEQIAASVRRAVADGSLAGGEQLPTASELGTVLAVNPNTVLRAYRRLRDEGVLEFRRGRGVRVAADAAAATPVVEAARQLLQLGRDHGYSPGAIAALLYRLESR
jgi:GntR family transcriptional regulator